MTLLRTVLVYRIYIIEDVFGLPLACEFEPGVLEYNMKLNSGLCGIIKVSRVKRVLDLPRR